jgi:hypothetical protein
MPLIAKILDEFTGYILYLLQFIGLKPINIEPGEVLTLSHKPEQVSVSAMAWSQLLYTGYYSVN